MNGLDLADVTGAFYYVRLGRGSHGSTTCPGGTGLSAFWHA